MSNVVKFSPKSQPAKKSAPKRARGLGGVYQREGGWWISYTFRGRRVREAGGFDGRAAKTRTEAAERLKHRLAELAAGRFTGPAAERASVDSLLADYLADLRLRGKKSAASVVSNLKHVRAAFGSDRVVDVTTDRIRVYVEARKAAGSANATINRGLQALRAAFRLAAKSGRGIVPPHVPLLSERDNVRRGFVEEGDLDPILERLPEAHADAVRFAYATGWRKGEVLGLAWSGVDRRAGTVSIPDSKNGTPRTVPVDAEIDAILDRRAAVRAGEYVFAEAGAYLWRFDRAWRKAATEAGFPGLLFHDLRRSAVRNLIRGGAHEAVVRTITGHKTSAMLQRYDITDTRDQSNALALAAEYRARQRAIGHDKVTHES